jgi:translocator protein
MRGVKALGGLVICLVLSFAAGGVGAALQGPADEVAARYAAFALPAWAPPGSAFGLVWPVLYVLVGIAGWRVWQAAGGVRPAAVALTLWAAQLVVNAAWPWVFFGLSRFGWAVGVIAVLVALVAATAVSFRRHDRLAAWLLTPYLAWLLYATALNVAVWRLN